MKYLLIGILALGSLSAMARENLTIANMTQLRDADLTSELRVYVNKRLTTIYEDVSLRRTEVDNGDVAVAVREEILKMIISKRTRGLITGASSDLTNLWVSFNSDCLEVACSYGFSLARGLYDLTSVPAVPNMRVTSVKAGTIFKSEPLRQYKTHLQFNMNELRNLVKRTVRAGGH
jgi:hypothetical protein